MYGDFMEEKEEGGISIGDIFRTIFSQKWLALIITAVITVVGTVGIYFYGSTKVDYSVSFVLQLPGSGDNSPAEYTYPDGELFYYTSMISAENLEIANSAIDENVDVATMLNRGDISITRIVNETKTTSENIEIYELMYKITVKAGYFKESDNAKAFLKKLAEIPTEHISGMNINYDYNITASQNALTYKDQLSELEKQVTRLQGVYDSLIATYGGDFTVKVGEEVKTLTTIKTETIDAYINSRIFPTLSNEAIKNGYVKDVTSAKERDIYESQLFEKEQELERAQATLDLLLDLKSQSGSVIYDEKLIEQSDKVQLLNQEIRYINNCLEVYKNNGTVNEEFAAKVSAVEAEVKKLTEDVKPIVSSVYATVTKVSYMNTGIIEVSGGKSLVISFVLSFVAALVVAAIVAYIVGYYRLKKSRAVKAEVVVYPEAQLQLAAAKDDEEEEKEDK